MVTLTTTSSSQTSTANQLKLLASSLSETQAPRPSFSHSLAKALGWGSNGIMLERLDGDSLPFSIFQGSIGGESATLFFGHRRRALSDLIANAALFAYHASVEWCVLTNALETIVFNSHWLRADTWYSLPPIRLSQLVENAGLLNGLTPEGVIAGQIDELVTERLSPDQQISPVDDALFDLLDSWRVHALRLATSSDRIDEKLHNLFVQLFVLRMVEDRKLLPRLPPISTLLQPGSAVQVTLPRIFAAAKREIQSELFDAPIPSELPDGVINGIVSDLYTPRHLPAGARYNFSWIATEILGRAYEKYVSTLLVPIPRTSPQIELWQPTLRDVERVSKRKTFGVFYTPAFIVNFLVGRCLAHYFPSAPSSSIPPPRLADIACGSGSFLTVAVDRIIKQLRRVEPNRNWGRTLIEDQCIIGIDIDERAVSLARLSLWLRLAQEPDPLPLPRLQETVVQGDALTESSWTSLPESYDIIVGNPPFIATRRIASRQELIATFRTAKGRYDYSYLFVEQAIRKLRTDGLLGLVVPNRLFRNRDAGTLRTILSSETSILTIVDFGGAGVFSGASAYIGLIIANKGRAHDDDHPARVILVEELPERFASVKLSLADSAAANEQTTAIRVFTARLSVGQSPWLLLSPSAIKQRTQLDIRSEPLSTMAAIVQGIKTGANDIFVVTLESESLGPIVKITNGLGETWLIEKELLRPVTFGSEIKRYSLVQPSRMLLYPYLAGEAIPEEVLHAKYPKTLAYLSAFKTALTARSSLLDGQRRWYELIRERDDRWLQARKLLMRDLAPQPAFALDDRGATALIGGTAIIPTSEDLGEVLLAYLNSSLVAWYLSSTTPTFQAGFKKIEGQHLEHLPVPLRLVEDSGLRDELSGLVRSILAGKDGGELEREVDRLIMNAAGMANTALEQ